MYRSVILSILLMLPVLSQAHQWTPTYPTWRPSYVEDVLVTSMTIFNGREEVDYYEIQVLDKDMEPVPFATGDRIFQVGHQKRKVVDVYISSKDEKRAVYICSRSKSLMDDYSTTIVSSRICSKSK